MAEKKIAILQPKEVDERAAALASWLEQTGADKVTVHELRSDDIAGIMPEQLMARLGVEEIWLLSSDTSGVTLVSQDARERLDRRLSNLTEKERAELNIVQEILFQNMLTYHFQPIVRVQDGEIFAYEALMRSSMGGVGPEQILRYAELTGHLGDVEKATFLNIMEWIQQNAQALGDRRIFINSIPGARVLPEDYVAIDDGLWANAEHIVVEMTEQTEADETKIRAMKRRYEQMGIDIALDDYGTGYSNVANLLQYMPRFVKIDRSLVNGIETDETKKHFVRDIIHFCHDNSILALAEGVETSGELQQMIWMGVDLVQGYYTARPAPLLLPEINPDIQREILRLHQEYEDRQGQIVFGADENGHLSLDMLPRSDYSCIAIGSGADDPQEIHLVGRQGMMVKAHVEIASGFHGKICLENTSFTSMQENPCFELGENCEVQLILLGPNQMERGGIRVPENSKLTIEGNGDLNMVVDAQESFGIGNDLESMHGPISFAQNGYVRIRMNGNRGVGIGSGRGGEVSISHGCYELSVNCEEGVGIGSFSGVSHTSLDDCAMEVSVAVIRGCGIGVMEGTSYLKLRNIDLRCKIECREGASYGVLRGACYTDLYNGRLSSSLRGEQVTGIGALHGRTDYHQERASLTITGHGKNALALGGYDTDTDIDIFLSENDIEINTAMQQDTLALPERFHIRRSRNRFIVNGDEVMHAMEDEPAENGIKE